MPVIVGTMVAMAGLMRTAHERSLAQSASIFQTGTHAEVAQEVIRLSDLNELDTKTIARWVSEASYQSTTTYSNGNGLIVRWDPTTKLADAAMMILFRTRVPVFPAIIAELRKLVSVDEPIQKYQSAMVRARFKSILARREETNHLEFADLLTMDLDAARNAALDYFDGAISKQEIGRRLFSGPFSRPFTNDLPEVSYKYGKYFQTYFLAQIRFEPSLRQNLIYSAQIDDYNLLMKLWDETSAADQSLRFNLIQKLRTHTYTAGECLSLIQRCQRDDELSKARLFPVGINSYSPEFLTELDGLIEEGDGEATRQGCAIPITNDATFRIVKKAFIKGEFGLYAAVNLLSWRKTDEQTKGRARDYIVSILEEYPLDLYVPQFSSYNQLNEILRKDKSLRGNIQKFLEGRVNSSDPILQIAGVHGLRSNGFDVDKYLPLLAKNVEKDRNRFERLSWFLDSYRGNKTSILLDLSKRLPPNRANFDLVFSSLLRTKRRPEIVQRMLKEGDDDMKYRAAMMLADQGKYSSEVVQTIVNSPPTGYQLPSGESPKPGGKDAYKCLISLFEKSPNAKVVAGLGTYIQGNHWEEVAFWMMLRTLRKPFSDEEMRLEAAKSIGAANPSARNHILFALHDLVGSQRPTDGNWEKEDDTGNTPKGQGKDYFGPIIRTLSYYSSDPSVGSIIRNMLVDQDSEKRWYAMIVLFEQDKISNEELNSMLDDDDFYVRLRAAQLLAERSLRVGPNHETLLSAKALSLLDQERAIDVCQPFEKLIQSANDTIRKSS